MNATVVSKIYVVNRVTEARRVVKEAIKDNGDATPFGKALRELGELPDPNGVDSLFYKHGVYYPYPKVPDKFQCDSCLQSYDEVVGFGVNYLCIHCVQYAFRLLNND